MPPESQSINQIPNRKRAYDKGKWKRANGEEQKFCPSMYALLKMGSGPRAILRLALVQHQSVYVVAKREKRKGTQGNQSINQSNGNQSTKREQPTVHRHTSTYIHIVRGSRTRKGISSDAQRCHEGLKCRSDDAKAGSAQTRSQFSIRESAGYNHDDTCKCGECAGVQSVPCKHKKGVPTTRHAGSASA